VWGEKSWKEFYDALSAHPWFLVRMGYRQGLVDSVLFFASRVFPESLACIVG